jgi:hypothetical protein
MNQLTVTVGDLLFEFKSFGHWVNSARNLFYQSGYSGDQTVCVDTKGRLCEKGKEFMRARDDDSFPIKVYRAVTED